MKQVPIFVTLSGWVVGPDQIPLQQLDRKFMLIANVADDGMNLWEFDAITGSLQKKLEIHNQAGLVSSAGVGGSETKEIP